MMLWLQAWHRLKIYAMAAAVTALAVPHSRVTGIGGDGGGVRKHGAPLKLGLMGTSGPGSGEPGLSL